MFDRRILVKLTQFCVRLVALWSQNGSFQTPQSCRFSIGLCSDAYLWSSILGNDRKNVNSGGSTKDGMFAQPRGFSRLDGARGLAPPCLNLSCFGSKCIVLMKKLAPSLQIGVCVCEKESL